jgi:hypothetical protein
MGRSGTAESAPSGNNQQSVEKTEKKDRSFNNGYCTAWKECLSDNLLPCHQANGEGIPNVFPPLAKSDYLKDKDATINAVLKRTAGTNDSKRKNYNGVMPPQNLTNEQTAAVLTYVYKNWGNSGKTVTPWRG